ncbi:MAG: hypothetical protein ACI9P7_001674 [Candidatus Azotimanducaceae bacterium]
MILIFGEKIKMETILLGERQCPVCQSLKAFHRVKESNYFCLFGLRVLPLEKIADYDSCESCKNAFPPNSNGAVLMPAQLTSLQRVLSYLLVGYGMQDHRALACDIYKKVTGFELHESDIRADINSIERGQSDLFSELAHQNHQLNTRGKQQIVEAAFLVTHSFCEIQFEDRLRINLIASAMGLPIMFVSATIDQVRKQGCYGVRRLLNTQTQA